MDEAEEAGSEEQPEQAAATAARSRGRKRPGDAVADRFAIPAAKKSKRGGGDATCSRCKDRSSKVPFHEVLLGNGTRTASTACKRCHDAFKKCWSHQFSWVDICTKCHMDKATDEAYEKTCAIHAGEMERDFPPSSVVGSCVAGYTVSNRLAIVWEKDIPSVFGSQVASRGLVLEKLPDASGGFSKGIVIQDPNRPFTELQVYMDVSLGKITEHMPASSCLDVKQVEPAYKAEKSAMVKGWPKSVRAWAKAPTLADLKIGAAAAEKACGEGSSSDEADDEDEDGEEEEPVECSGSDKECSKDDQKHIQASPFRGFKPMTNTHQVVKAQRSRHEINVCHFVISVSWAPFHYELREEDWPYNEGAFYANVFPCDCAQVGVVL